MEEEEIEGFLTKQDNQIASRDSREERELENYRKILEQSLNIEFNTEKASLGKL